MAISELLTDVRTMADLLEQLGGIDPARVRIRPPLGEATEQDVVAIRDSERRLFELLDGVLVEKEMGLLESLLAGALIEALRQFVRPRNLGVVSREAGMLRLFPGLVRIPDVAFISWDRFPGRKLSRDPVPALAPDLAIEVLSKGNTRREMDRKLIDYFAAGVKLAWLVDPVRRIVTVYTAPDQYELLTEADELTGGEVLTGFRMPIRQLFAELDQTGAA